MVFDLKFPPQETIKLLANYLSFIVLKNDQRSDTQRNLTRFHARTIPSIDIVGYLTRILKYAPCGTECFLAILIYLERLSPDNSLLIQPTETTNSTVGELELKLEGTFITKNSNPIVIDSFNIHRLIISAALVSIKFLSDVFYTNLHISRVGGVPVVELNQLELEFLKRCNFNLMVTPMELIACGETLQKFSTFPEIIEGSVTKHDQHHQISSTSIPNRLHETLLKNSLKEFVGSRQTVLIRDKSSSNTSSESSLDAIGHVETFQNQMFETNIETIQDIQYKHLDMISKSISTSCSTLSMNHSMETIQIEQIIRLKQSRSMNGSKSSNTYKRQKIPLAIAGESRLRSCSSSVCKKIHCHQCGKSKTRCVCKI